MHVDLTWELQEILPNIPLNINKQILIIDELPADIYQNDISIKNAAITGLLN